MLSGWFDVVAMGNSYQSAAVIWRPFVNLDFIIFKFNLLTKFRSWADGSQKPARQQAVDVGRNILEPVTISFDLDDTLIPGTKLFDIERQNIIQRICGVEKLRAGTIRLIKALQGQGHKVFIYTTSFRSTTKIWWTFFTYGIRINKVINQQVHDRTLKEKSKQYSKYPPAFNIDLHIDDSKGVKIEGERFNFRTIIVTESTHAWTDYIQQMLLT